MKKLAGLILTAALVTSLIGCSTSSTGSEQGGGSGKVKKITIAHGAAESFHLHRALLEFKKDVTASGKFEVEIYPAAQFGNDTEMIEAVHTGDLTMAVPPSSFLTSYSQDVAMIELPYVYPSREAAIKTLEGKWGQSQIELLDKAGLHSLGYYENGLRHITNSKHEIKSPNDLKGLKLRTMQVPTHVEFWNSLGSSAEGSPFAELYTNLSTKVFDGQENPIAHIDAQKFYEVQKYITLTGHVYTAYMPLVTAEFWDSLSDEEKKIINDAYEKSYDYQLKLVADEEAAQLKKFKDFGCVVTTLTEDEKQEFIKAAEPTLKKYRDMVGEAAYDEFIDAIAQAK